MSAFDPEEIWQRLLSRRPEEILGMWRLLSAEQRASVAVHLRRMTEDDGWAEPQRESARAALDVLREDDGS